MQLARVLGQVVSTIKEPGLARYTLLLVQDATGSADDEDPARSNGPAYVAVDLVGATPVGNPRPRRRRRGGGR